MKREFGNLDLDDLDILDLDEEETVYADIENGEPTGDLEDEFSMEIPDEEIENIKTVGDLVTYIENH